MSRTTPTMSHQQGFTIVELLVVIVVIGILAAITVVAYNGISQRAAYAEMQSDFNTLQKGIAMYKAEHDEYPDSTDCVNSSGNTNYEHGWCGWSQGTGDSFIPGVSPEFVPQLPNLPEDREQRDSYVYRSSSHADGINAGTTYYQLLRFSASGLSKIEIQEANPLGGQYGGTLAWGVKSDASIPWW